MANDTQLDNGKTQPIGENKMKTIAVFGIAVLQLLEASPEWSADTVDLIQQLAADFDLCELDTDDGMFKAKIH